MLGCIAVPALIAFAIYFIILPDPEEHKKWVNQVDQIERDVLAQDTLREGLRDPESAEFTRTRVSSRGGIQVTCGYVNARNGFGGHTGPQRFVSGTGINELEENGASFDEAWQRYC
jgi:hypothetical protein